MRKMNLKYTIMAGCLLMMGLASCEMKNEILGKEETTTQMGLLDLGVTVNSASNTQTKADAAISTNGYIVEISNKEGLYKTLTYDPANTAVELPVDQYTVYAHTPGDPVETSAYYGGNSTFSITKDVTTNVNIVCKMENTKFQLIYSPELLTYFKSGTITVAAGDRLKVFSVFNSDGSLSQPEPFFWMLEAGVKEVKVSFAGKNSKDQDIRQSMSFRKQDGADWGAADALAITVNPGTYDPDPSGVIGIDISAEVKWEGEDDIVDVPVIEDDDGTGDNPGTGDPDPDAITVSIPQTTYTLPDDANKQSEAIAVIESPKGLKSLKVVIEAGNAGFGDVVDELAPQGCDFKTGVELVDADGTMAMTLINTIAPELKAPAEGNTSYEFPLGAFFEALQEFNETTLPAGHVFKIRVEDAEGNVNDETVLSVVIK